MQARYPRTAPGGSLTLRDAGEFVETRRWFMPIIRTGCKAVFPTSLAGAGARAGWTLAR